VVDYLRALALPVDEDDAGTRIDSTIGNLLCRIEPSGEGAPLFFCAHLDTVPPQGPIEPVIEDGVVRNGGGTILGADNKAAVAAMLEATRRIVAENRPHGGIELLFHAEGGGRPTRRGGLRPGAPAREGSGTSTTTRARSAR
jgi:acetylornithine deacetylase/succinyl-diaminopimelate desuccinylase-like protein